MKFEKTSVRSQSSVGWVPQILHQARTTGSRSYTNEVRTSTGSNWLKSEA
ncbi:hypothetical protein LC593_16085 [Nostoc sp. CHAB 5844]|nr:hypothetical protein [Nostoc sp. CHAB 5844]